MSSRHLSVLAPAKINLRLIVLERQESGYHSLETVFCGIRLADRIQVRPGNGIDFHLLGNDIDTGPIETNLVLRAARAFYEMYGGKPAVSIALQKRIPSAAGLGGGSSDAAATLRILNAMHGDPIPAGRLLECGARIGSDVPFFLTPTPFALAWGRGERLLSLRPLPRRHVVIVHTGADVPTAWAFERLPRVRQSTQPQAASVISSADLASWERLAPLARNDFEAVGEERIPPLPRVVETLSAGGAEIAMLTGTGGAVFGIFDSEAAARTSSGALSAQGFRTWVVRTLREWPRPRPTGGGG